MESRQHVTARWMSQFAKGFSLDLADSFASDGKELADLPEGMFHAVSQPEAHLDNLFLARSQGFKN
jgi:hypothetical protein